MASHLAHEAALLARGDPTLRIIHERIGTADVYSCSRWPHHIGLNRAYAVDASEPGTFAAIVRHFTDQGLRPLLEIIPQRLSTSAMAELVRLGLTQVWEVVELTGDAQQPRQPAPTGIQIHRCAAADAQAFAALAVEAYEFSTDVRPFQLVDKAAHCADTRALCLIAEVAETPCAVGMLSIYDQIAVLGGGATLPRFRQRGCQAALLAHRIHAAHDVGIHHFFVRAMAASASQRNLERTGLRPSQLRQVWGHVLR